MYIYTQAYAHMYTWWFIINWRAPPGGGHEGGFGGPRGAGAFEFAGKGRLAVNALASTRSPALLSICTGKKSRQPLATP